MRMSKGVSDQGWVCRKIFTLKQIGKKTREKKRRMYANFMELEKAYDGINRKALWLWQVLRMYDVGSKLLSGI